MKKTVNYNLLTKNIDNPHSSHSFVAAEFFAGVGLVRLALEQQRWKVVFANDIDPHKAEMYRHNWPTGDHLVVGDIHNLEADDVPTCDLFTASFPCTDLSIAGRWEGLSGKHSSAFWGLIRIIGEMDERKPPLVLIENVVGFLLSRAGRDFEKALLALSNLGYTVDAFILNAVHWVPQSRARLFVVAKRDDGQVRQTVASISESRPRALVDFIRSHEGIRWDIRTLPALPTHRMHLSNIVERLSKDDGHWWSKKRCSHFMAQLSKKHKARAEVMIDGKRVTYGTAFRRMRNQKSMAELRVDGIAGCLRTPRGGSARQILFAAGRGKYKVRLLTARECARLQGVPDAYPIKVALNRALFGFGDAVCVPVIKWIDKNYLKPILKRVRASKKVTPGAFAPVRRTG